MDINDTSTFQPVVASVLAVSGGRAGSGVATVVALAGAVVGGVAVVRSIGRGGPDRGPGDRIGSGLAAVVLGLSGAVLGVVLAATADGDVGSGNGRGGAFVAVVLGLIGVALGGVARSRTRGVA